MLPYWKSRNVRACLGGGTPSLKLSHVGPTPEWALVPDNFLPPCGIFCSCGAIRAAQGPGLGACAADICTRAHHHVQQQHFREGSSMHCPGSAA